MAAKSLTLDLIGEIEMLNNKLLGSENKLSCKQNDTKTIVFTK